MARCVPHTLFLQAYPEFMHNKEGIYHHTGLHDPYNLFELTNHVVLLVGYGHCHMTGQKNSWGTEGGLLQDPTGI